MTIYNAVYHYPDENPLKAPIAGANDADIILRAWKEISMYSATKIEIHMLPNETVVIERVK